jgi:hypothetical protein
MQRRLLKKHAVAKSKKERESEMWKTFDNENEMSVGEAEVVGGVAVPSIPGAQALRGHLHDDEIHHVVDRRPDETSTPTFPKEEAIEDEAPEAGLVPDRFPG